MKSYAFTGGRTPPESFPIEELIVSSRKALKEKGKFLVNYPTQIDLHSDLKDVISLRFSRREKITIPKENILITVGSMEAILLSMMLFTKPGDTIICEELTYMGTLKLFKKFGLNVHGIQLDKQTGMNINKLEDKLEELAKENIKPKFIYTIPNYHNPTGSILSEDKKRHMLEVSKKYDVLILEDDCYVDVDLENVIYAPSLYSMDNSNQVIYISSFSKILAPGIRLGFLCAPPKILNNIIEIQKCTTIGAGAFASLIIADYLKDNLDIHLKKHNKIIREKRDTVVNVLTKNFKDKDSVTWNTPRGGLFIWVKLPNNIRMNKLEQCCSDHNVAFNPGRDFHFKNQNINYLRLSYAHMIKDDIREGIDILSECIKKACESN